ncbi:MAG: hypothetical protein ACE5IY_05735 [bacterium]
MARDEQVAGKFRLSHRHGLVDFRTGRGLALLIVLLTMSTQAVRAAVANPVEALRYE